MITRTTPHHIKTLFPGQQADEKICKITRPHIIVLITKFFVWLVFAAFLIIFDQYIVPNYEFLSNEPFVAILNLARSVYLMGLVATAFTLWTLYYLNLQIITNERVVDITQDSLLHHTTSELNLNRIQDVTAEIKGIFGTFFDYGNVYLQTAAEIERFEFNNVPHPHQVAKLVLDLYEHLPSDQKTATGAMPPHSLTKQ